MKQFKYIIAIFFLPILVFAQTNEPNTPNITVENVSVSDQENIKSIADTIEKINKQSKITESEIRNAVNDDLKNSIDIISSKTTIENYKIREQVEQPLRNQLHQELENVLKNASASADIQAIIELKKYSLEKINEIENTLTAFAGVAVDFADSKSKVSNSLDNYKAFLEQIIKDEQNADLKLLELDSDNDGISDYDEKYIFKTDLQNPNTTGGDQNDAEKILAGINPQSPDFEKINYENPKENKTAPISALYTVERVEKISNDKGQKVLQLSGTALPNSFITLYIFSSPVVVTIKTDGNGSWVYTLDKELQDGNHEVFVTTVDNSGRILARSESIPFAITKEVAALGTFSIGDPNSAANDFVQENFILIIFAILLSAILITLILTGHKSNKIEMEENKQDNNIN